MIDTAALAPGWKPLVDMFLASERGGALQAFLRQRQAAGARIFPPRPLRALELVAFDEVRVVIVGQDPYHGADQAHGLAFSVPAGTRLPPSLRNIYVELAREYGDCPPSGDLQHWAQQGVLLLNAVLTVEESQPGSHAQRGWEALTDALLQALCADARPKVFMLWGAHAQRWRSLLDSTDPLRADGQPSVAAVGAPSAAAFCRLRTLHARQCLPGSRWTRNDRLGRPTLAMRRARASARASGRRGRMPSDRSSART